MERQDLHLSSVLGTRKLALAGLNIRVEAVDEAEDVRRADMLQEVIESPGSQRCKWTLPTPRQRLFREPRSSGTAAARVGAPAFQWRDRVFFMFDRETGQGCVCSMRPT
ncbi:DUF935 domain-containing protein [Pseudomonas qingdaonensis]|nr:DUF935 domain-containing protein [Pseudomonas qingdaonensis]